MARWTELLAAVSIGSLVTSTAWAGDPTEGFSEPIIQWGVQPGTTCRDIARSVYGDEKHVALVTRYNRVTCGGPLPEGMTLVLPAEPTVLPAAKLRSVNPQVNARPPGGGWSTAASGQPLTSKSSVNTLDTGRADIQFIDRTRVFLAENTLVIVYGTASQTVVSKQRPPAVELEEGEVSAGLAALRGGEVSVTTRTGGRVDAASKDTIVQAKGERTTVAVFDGLAKVTSAGATVAVPKNHGSRFFKAKPPSKPRPLPPAPEWDQSPPQLLFASAQGAELAATWKPVPKARAYRVELAREPSFRDLIAREEVAATVQSFRVEKLPPGDYHLRVRAIDDEDYLGIARASAAQIVSVGSAGALEVGAGWMLVNPYDALSFAGSSDMELALGDGAFGPAPPTLDLGRHRPAELRFRRKGQQGISTVQVRYKEIRAEVSATWVAGALQVSAELVGLDELDVAERVGPSARVLAEGGARDVALTKSERAWIGSVALPPQDEALTVQLLDRRGRVLGTGQTADVTEPAIEHAPDVTYPVIGVTAVPWHLSARSSALWWSPTAQNAAQVSVAGDGSTDTDFAGQMRVMATGAVGNVGLEGAIRSGATGDERVAERSAWFGLRLRALRIGLSEVEAGPALRVGIPVTNDAHPVRLEPALGVGGVDGQWTWLANVAGRFRMRDSAERDPIDPGRASLLAGGTYDVTPWLRALAVADGHMLFESGGDLGGTGGLSLGAEAGEVVFGGLSGRVGIPTDDEPLVGGQVTVGVRAQ